MKTVLFQGVCTALVTPFEHGKISLTTLDRLLDRQLEAGIRAIVICGTTGESPVLSDEEKLQLFREAKRQVGDQALILAGTGSNCTDHAVRLSMAAADQGADGLLVVTPYYNKASESGLLRHYEAIAQAVSIPLVLYNVPSRTGVDLSPALCRELSAMDNVAGIKEASPDLRKLSHLRSICPPEFTVWSGNDDLLLPMVAMGAKGVISVASNVYPARMKALTDLALESRFSEAWTRFEALLPLLDALFCEVNPIPVKAAMDLLGLNCGGCRLPLTSPSREHLKLLKEALEQASPADM